MSDVESLISYSELGHYVIPLGAMNTPSQLHGMLCGKLCGGQRLSADQWLMEAVTFLDIITDESGVVGDDDGSAQAAISRLYSVTLAQLQDPNFSFQLLLPDDGAQMQSQVASLGEWCHGFLVGFGSAGISPETTFSSEASESLKDLAAIASVDTQFDEEDDEAEVSLIELVEYVRMAVLTLFAESAADDAPQQSPTVH